MSKVKYSRSVRHEICAVLLVLSAPIILCSLFPFKAVSFAPAKLERAGTTAFEFVRITPEYERSLMAKIRSTWSAGRNAGALMMSEIPIELPSEVLNIKLNSEFPPSLPCGDFIKYDFIPMPTSVAQEPYAKLSPVENTDKKDAFTKEELLILPELNKGE